MERTAIHNILVCVGDGYDQEFHEFTKEHSVSLEPGGNSAEAEEEGTRFAHFLAEFCDPAWLKGLSDALPSRPSPWCMVIGYLEGMPYYIANFCIDSIPHGSYAQEETEAKIKPLLKKKYDSLLVIAIGSEMGTGGTPQFWCWHLRPPKIVPSYKWMREGIQ